MQIAAMVMVIISSGMLNHPIRPKTDPEASMLGKMATKAILSDRNKTKNIAIIAKKTTPMVRIWERNRLSKTLLYKTSKPVNLT